MTAVKFVATSLGVVVLLAVLSWVVSPSEPEIGFGGVARPVTTSAGTEPEPTEAERWSRTVRIAPGIPLTDFRPKAPTAVMDSARYRGTRTGLTEVTLEWPDGSTVVTFWRSAENAALVLDRIGE